MALTEGIRLQSGSSATQLADIDANGILEIKLPTESADVGALRTFSLSDEVADTDDVLRSPEMDDDYRIRFSRKIILDQERFRYTAQNTNKHRYNSTTMTANWSTTGIELNSSGITTVNTGVIVSTYAQFPVLFPGVTVFECEVSFNAQPTTNARFLAGLFLPNTVTSNPLGGVFFRLLSTGFEGVISVNGGASIVSFPAFTYTNDTIIKLRIGLCRQSVHFYINDVNYGEATPSTLSLYPMQLATSLPAAFQQYIITGSAGADFRATILGYRVSQNGLYVTRDSGEFANAVRGSYVGLSGDTMGSLASYDNSANPTAAVPTNSSALVTGLGGQAWETDTLAVDTDGIIFGYQIPPVSVTQRRLVITSIRIHSYVQTAIVNGGYVAQWSLAFGSTSMDLATTETATTKAPRRIALGSQTVAANAPALTLLRSVTFNFVTPVYVNPEEYIAIVKKKVGTAPDSGVVAHLINLDYTWE